MQQLGAAYDSSGQASGTVLSWSVDGNRLVLGREGGDPGLPGLVSGITVPVVAVAAGGHSLAVGADGSLWSWGRNDSRGGGGGGSRGIPDSGQLGTPRDPAAAREAPGRLLLPGGPSFVGAAAGRYHSVGLDAQGAVFTWGLNDHSQLGRPGLGGCVGGATCRDPQPRRVPGLPRIAAVAAGRYHTLALAADGALYTWGLNLCGRPEVLAAAAEAGVPPARLALVAPQRVAGGGLESARLVAVDAGYVHWVALADDGAVWTCDTGFDGYGGGLPETQRSGGWRPPNLQGELGRPLPGSGSGGGGDGGGAARRNASELGQGLMPGRVPGLAARAVAAGRCFTAAATKPDGRVLAWGCGLGGGSQSDRPRPLAGVGAGSAHGPAARLAGGEWSAAAVTEGGRVLVWGGTGRLQHGATADPAPLKGQPPGSKACTVSSAHQHFLVLVTKGQCHSRQDQSGSRGGGRGGGAAASSGGDSGGDSSSGGGGGGNNKGDARGDKASSVPEAAARDQQQQGVAQQQEQEMQGAQVGQQQQQQQARPESAAGAAVAAAAEQQPQGQGQGQGQRQEQQRQRQHKKQNREAGQAPELTPELRGAAPDIFDGLQPFDPAYRNPCFRNRTSGALRCLPFFSIIGVSKAGTTDLHRKLMLLPGFKESRNKVGPAEAARHADRNAAHQRPCPLPLPLPSPQNFRLCLRSHKWPTAGAPLLG